MIQKSEQLKKFEKCYNITKWGNDWDFYFFLDVCQVAIVTCVSFRMGNFIHLCSLLTSQKKLEVK